jgi:hypothetical protein
VHMGKAENILVAGLLSGAALYVAHETYNEEWHVTRNEAGAINGFGSGPGEIVEIEPTTTVQQVPPGNVSELESTMQTLARSEQWCSTKKMLYFNFNIPGVYIPEPHNPTRQTYEAELCLDDTSIEVRNDTVSVIMGTQPEIPQIEGNPSIYLTYLDPFKVNECIEAKEEMRLLVIDGLQRALTVGADDYEVKIYVDARSQDHPCDDGIQK